MTDRDHFAAAALTGLIARAGEIPFDGVADCYEWADAMLRERERVTEPLLKEKQAEVSVAPVSRPPETRASFSATNHDAAPAARAQLPEADHAACRSRESDAGTGNQTAPPCVETDRASSCKCVPPAAATQRVGSDEGRPLDAGAPTRDHAAGGRGRDTQEPVAFAVMSGGRSYDIYDTRGEATAICRWLCDEESGDIWRVVPLVPCDATQPSHATHGECSVHPCGSEPVAWAVENPDGDIHTIAYRRDRAEDHLASASERVVPLYRQPALTAEECEAIELAAYDYLYHQDPGGRAQWIRQQLLGLLARTK